MTITATQERTEWLEWRRNGITATDAAKIAHLSPWGTPWTVWADKVGLVDDSARDVTDAMEFGTRAEPILANWFTDRTGYNVIDTQRRVTHPTDTWARATLDGIATTIDGTIIGGVEFKTTPDAVTDWERDGIPLYYACQVQWQMYCTGLATTYIPTLHLAHGRLKFAVHRIDRDDDDIATLVTMARTLWNDHIVTGAAPDVDNTGITATALGQAWPDPADAAIEADDELAATVADLVRLKWEAKSLEDAITFAENTIKAALADRTTITYGADNKGRPRVIATWKPQGRTTFDHKAAIADDPTLERYMTTTTHRTLRPKTIKEN